MEKRRPIIYALKTVFLDCIFIELFRLNDKRYLLDKGTGKTFSKIITKEKCYYLQRNSSNVYNRPR